MVLQFAIVLLMIVLLLDKKNVVDAVDVKTCYQCKYPMGLCVPQYDPVYNPPPPDCCYITEYIERNRPHPTAYPSYDDVRLCSVKSISGGGDSVELRTNLPVRTIQAGDSFSADFNVKTNCPPDHHVLQQVNAVEWRVEDLSSTTVSFIVASVNFSQPIYATPTKPIIECSAAFNLARRQQELTEQWMRGICPHLFPTPPPTVCAMYCYCERVFDSSTMLACADIAM
jgi:hypothetical protein